MAKKTPNPVDRHVGARVRMQRLAIGMSQQALGKELGVTFQQVQKYEKGSNRIGASRLQQIASVLRVPPAYFFEGVAAAPTPKKTAGFEESNRDYTVELLSSTDGLALVKAFLRVGNRKLRRSIVDFVKQVSTKKAM